MIGRPIPVVYFIHRLGYGGAQRVILGTAKRLDRSRYSPSVVILGGRMDLKPEFDAIGVPVNDLHSRWKIDPPALLRFRRLLRSHRPCILHTHLALTGAIGRVVGRSAGVPVIVSTEQSHPDALHPLTRLADRATFGLADALTAISLGIEEAYWGDPRLFTPEAMAGGRRHVTIRSGVEVERLDEARRGCDREARRREFGFEPDDLVVGCVGRLHPVKGQRYLIEALESLLPTHPRLRALLLGDGELAGELRGRVAAGRLESRVVFGGYRDDVPDLLPIMDIVVVPSLFEAFGISIAEAMAVGIPVISTATSGAVELVVHGQTGLLVPCANAGALACAMARLVADRNERREMGRRGLERVGEGFTVDRMASQYSLLYDLLAARKGLLP